MSRNQATRFALMIASLACFATAQRSPFYDLAGKAPNVRFGLVLAAAGDVDGDGHDDFLVGSPFEHNAGTDSGSVYVYSGRTSWTGQPLRRIDGRAGERLGRAVAGAGDVDGDGHADFVVATDNPYGPVRVYSGNTGALLWSSTGGAVAGVGDVDRDGYDDVAVGGLTTVRVLSGRDGRSLFTTSTAPDYTAAIAAAGDANGDGHPDIIVGALGGTPTGRALVLSGRDGRVLNLFLGPVADSRFGQSVSGFVDVDNDGTLEVLVGAPYAYMQAGLGYDGEIYLLSTGLNRALATVRGTRGEALGMSIGSLDFDGDRILDVIAGAPQSSRIRAFSGATLTPIGEVQGRSGEQLGWACAAAGDIDRDGYADLLAGAPSAGTDRQGRAMVYRQVPHSAHQRIQQVSSGLPGDGFGRCLVSADLDGDGRRDLIVASPSENQASGAVRAISGGGTWRMLWRTSGTEVNGRLGSSLAVAPDFNGDGVPDIATGAPQTNGGLGMGLILSGRDGSILLRVTGQSHENLGYSAAAGDWDGNGTTEVLFGTPAGNGATAGEGALYVVATNGNVVRRASGQPGAQAYVTLTRVGRALPGNADCFVTSLQGPGTIVVFNAAESRVVPGVSSMSASAAGLGDVDGDGLTDVVVGNRHWNSDQGRAIVWSPAANRLIRELRGSVVNQGFAATVGSAGDADADGIEDLLVSVFGAGTNEVRLHSGRDGRLLQSLATDGFTYNLASMAMLDASGYDSRSMFALGMPGSQANSVGVLEVWAPQPPPVGSIVETFGFGCPAADGRLPRMGSQGMPGIGRRFTVAVHTAPRNATAVLMLDYARHALDLGVIGFPGCIQRTLPRLLAVRTTTAAGDANVSYDVPVDPALIGGEVHHQWIVVDLQTPTAAVSDGLTIRVGER